MRNEISISVAGQDNRDAIISLLQSEKLPVGDIPTQLEKFFVAINEGVVIGAAGVEAYGKCGLLRSVVVKSAYRKLKIAEQLVNEIENLGRNEGIDTLYLLTETAGAYFSKRGYQAMPRAEAPRSIQESSEFSHACPSSAMLMRKEL